MSMTADGNQEVWTSYRPYRHSKPKIDHFTGLFGVHILWLGRWYIIKTFDKMDECDVDEILRILDNDGGKTQL